MIKSDIMCPHCKAGYRRIELKSKPWIVGEFRCLTCGEALETLDGTANVAFRLTVQPARPQNSLGKADQTEATQYEPVGVRERFNRTLRGWRDIIPGGPFRSV
jgi:DNA-directed RNA polymerase subunit RPC12/RpoP